MLGLPDFDGNELLKCIHSLVNLEHAWIPPIRNYSLYVRPCFISMDNKLGLILPNKARIFVICFPFGPYYPKGFDPLQLYCEKDSCRTAKGLVGSYKVAGY